MIFVFFFAFFLPPVSVALAKRGCTREFWISLVLTILCWLPGVIYALLVALGIC